MQPNIITIPVDLLNDGTVVNQDYERFEENLNRSRYITAAHTMASRDELTMYRTFPKKAGNFLGVGKSAVKFSTDISVPGTDSSTSLKSTIIFEVSASVPVGADPADVLIARQRLIGLLDNDAIMSPLNDKLTV